MVSSAHYRVQVRGVFRVGDLERPVEELFAGMEFEVVRRHGVSEAEVI
jgi:hypothetical protein